jgi:hypothetical protein
MIYTLPYLSLEVDENVHDVGTCLKHFGIRGVTALRFDHLGKLTGEIHV